MVHFQLISKLFSFQPVPQTLTPIPFSKTASLPTFFSSVNSNYLPSGSLLFDIVIKPSIQVRKEQHSAFYILKNRRLRALQTHLLQHLSWIVAVRAAIIIVKQCKVVTIVIIVRIHLKYFFFREQRKVQLYGSWFAFFQQQQIIRKCHPKGQRSNRQSEAQKEMNLTMKYKATETPMINVCWKNTSKTMNRVEYFFSFSQLHKYSGSECLSHDGEREKNVDNAQDKGWLSKKVKKQISDNGFEN